MKLGCSTLNVVYFGMALLSEKTVLVLFHSVEGNGTKSRLSFFLNEVNFLL